MQREDKLSGSLTAILNDMGDWDPPPEVSPEQPVIPLHIGIPTPDCLPLDAMQDIADQVLQDRDPSTWAYGFGPGYLPLRTALAAHWSATFGTVNDPDYFQVTQGSSGAIDMLGRSLLNPGDVVFMEYPCYMGTYRNFRALGAQIEFIRSDSGGIDVDHLRERVLALTSAGQVLKFVYTIAEFSNPTGARLSNPRRKALLELSSELDLLVIDDAAYAELDFDTAPSSPSTDYPFLGRDAPSHRVISVGSLSKTLATGLRIGWIHASPNWQQLFGQMRFAMGLNQFSVRLASGLFASGAYARHVDQMKQHYCDRMTQLHDAVLKHCGDKVRVIKPLGGFYLWVQVPTDHVTVWKTAYKKGIHVIPGRNFRPESGAPEPPKDYLRLAYPFTPIEDFDEAGQRLNAAIVDAMK